MSRVCLGGAISASRTSPRRVFSMLEAMRWPRRSSSSSSSKAREMKIVSSARPSVVVKIWASTILPPAAAQAPAMPVRSRG
jgi:hypothetical protein